MNFTRRNPEHFLVTSVWVLPAFVNYFQSDSFVFWFPGCFTDILNSWIAFSTDDAFYFIGAVKNFPELQAAGALICQCVHCIL